MTFRCHISSDDYAKVVFSNFWADSWLWLVPPFLLLFGLAVIDIRFLLVGVMVFMVMVPMAMALLFFNLMLTLETRYSIADKEVELSDKGIRLTFADANMQPRLLPWSDFKAAYRKGSNILLTMRLRRYQYFVIPLHAVPDHKKLIDFITLKLGQPA